MTDASSDPSTKNPRTSTSSLPIPVNDLSRSWLANDEAVSDAVSAVVASGWYVQGPAHDAFESELANYLDISAAAGVGSGTAALEIALRALGCGPGQGVLVAPNAGGYVSIAAARVGAPVTFCDVDSGTLVCTPATVAAALSDDVRVVVVTHLFGNVADVPGIRSIIGSASVAVLEDCAQALGGSLNGIRAGSMGDASAFSFYPTKNLGGIGDGGAIASPDTSLIAQCRSLRNYGWSSRYEIGFAGGTNNRLDEIQAAVLRLGLRRLDMENEARRTVVRLYDDAAAAGGVVRIVTQSEPGSAAHLAVAMAPDGSTRDALANACRKAGIGTAIHYPVLDPDQPALLSGPADVPVARSAVDRILTLPLFSRISDDEVHRVCGVLSSPATWGA